MKSTVETLSPTRVKLAVEVPFDELRTSFDEAYKKIGSQVRVPGFRPGKVPGPVLERRLGRGAILEEVVQDAVPKAYTDAVRDNDVRALGQPQIEVTRIDDGDALAFTAEVDIRPVITLPDIEGLTATVDDIEVADEDVDSQIDALRERFATLTGVERPVQTGDYVSIDLTATVDGEPVQDGSATGLSYEVGSDDLVKGLDDALVGMTLDEEKTFRSELVAGEKAGQTADVVVVVRSIKEKELPELDDEFAQTASEFDTLEELRADLTERVKRVKALQQAAQARDRVVEALLEQVDIPVPESVLESEIEARQHDAVHAFDHDEARFEQWLSSQGQTREEFDAEVRETAEKGVRTQLVLDAVADAKEISVDEGELTEHIMLQAQRYGMAPEEFARQIGQAGSVAAVFADVRRNKALGLLVDAATVTDASGNPVDLAALRQRPTTGEGEAGEDESGEAGEDVGADGNVADADVDESSEDPADDSADDAEDSAERPAGA